MSIPHTFTKFYVCHWYGDVNTNRKVSQWIWPVSSLYLYSLSNIPRVLLSCLWNFTVLLQLNILLNGIIVEELSMVVHGSKASSAGRKICLKLKDIIPRQLIEVQKCYLLSVIICTAYKKFWQLSCIFNAQYSVYKLLILKVLLNLVWRTKLYTKMFFVLVWTW